MVGSVHEAVPSRISPPPGTRIGRLAASATAFQRSPAASTPGSWGSGGLDGIGKQATGDRRPASYPAIVRLAVVSDVHGALAALEAVIADLRLTGPDLVVQGGD